MVEPEEKKPEEKPTTEITILDRKETTTYPTLKKPLVQVLVTYAAGDYPPRTVFINKTDWTPDKEKELIRKDLEELEKTKVETYRV